jgi:hypothetical protein
MNDHKDNLPKNLLTPDEIIEILRLDYNDRTGEHGDRPHALRKLRLYRDTKRISFIRLGHSVYRYPRAGVEKFKRQNLFEAQ